MLLFLLERETFKSSLVERTKHKSKFCDSNWPLMAKLVCVNRPTDCCQYNEILTDVRVSCVKQFAVRSSLAIFLFVVVS